MAEYLDRDALCDALSEHVRHMPTHPTAYWTGFADAASFVGRFSVAADVAPVRHGKWVWITRHYGGFPKYTGLDEQGLSRTITVDTRCEVSEPYCPHCGKRSEGIYLHYCSNCGAKMDGGDGV